MKNLLLFSILFLTTQLTFSQWSQLGTNIDGEAIYDGFGWSVSLSSDGTVVAIGANTNDGTANDAGHVRIYQFDGLTWNQLGDDIDGEAADDWFGVSVSLSDDGNILAVGANQNDGTASNAGHVRIYQFDGFTWDQLGDDIDGESFLDQSGISVSLSSDGSIVAIGANANNGNGTGSGHVRIYQFDGFTWNQLGDDINGEAEGDQSGWSVDISSNGTIVAIGARTNDDNGSNSGHVRIYEFDGSTWNQLGNDIVGEADGDQSGRSVSLSNDGNIVAIGASRNDDNGILSGHVRIYQFDGFSWNQLGDDIDGEAADDESGFSISLSSDGSIVAIGAIDNNGSGVMSGHVRIYQFDDFSWNQIGSDIHGEAADDRSGWSVSLSSDGSTVAIGSVNSDNDSGIQSGHVRVFNNPAIVNNLYTAIPDANFEAVLAAYDDIPGDGQVPTANIEAVTNLNVSNQNIADLTGIEDFTALETLYCFNNLLTNLNITQNTNLIELYCNDNQLVNLDTGLNTSLTTLRCENNQLSTIDVTGYSNLTLLICSNNQLTDLDVTQNNNLERLYCNDNQLTDLDVTQNVNLELLYCQNNQLTNLDMGLNPNLNYLICSNNQLTTLNVTENPNLSQLSCNNNQLATLEITQNINLTDLSCSDNLLAVLDVTQNTTLETLSCYNNQLVTLDVTQNPNLRALNCSSNQLAILDVTQNTNLQTFSCYNNQLAALDVTQNTNLASLQCYLNQLTDLDMTQNPNLTNLRCQLNQLTSLNVTQSPNLYDLRCFNNQLTDLDVTQNPNLVRLYCQNNQLTILDVTQNTSLTILRCSSNQLTGNLILNGLNSLVSFNSSGNPALGCIQVDNAADATARVGQYSSWSKDPATSYSESCVAYTTIPDTNFEAALAAYDDIPGDNQVPTDNISGITYLDVSNQNIADLTGIEDFVALETLYCEFNLLTSLNVTQNPNLTFLSCYNNQLTTLDVTQNPNLTTLWTATNQLTNLDVTQNPNITDLRCFSNQLTTLDVSQNPNLVELRCYDNQLTTLEFTQNPNLLHVYCNTNALATIDVSQNLNLITLACHENLLTGLDVSQNPNLTGLYSHNNPLLFCIEVANAADANAAVGIYSGWSRDGATSYSEDCGMMARSTNISNTKDNEENTIETALSLVANDVVLYPNPVKDQLYIVLPVDSKLTAITLYNVKGEQVAKAKSTTISTTHIAAGVYFIKIQLLGGESITKKVIVSRN